MVGPKSAVFFRVPSLVKGKNPKSGRTVLKSITTTKRKKRVRERARAHTHTHAKISVAVFS